MTTTGDASFASKASVEDVVMEDNVGWSDVESGDELSDDESLWDDHMGDMEDIDCGLDDDVVDEEEDVFQVEFGEVAPAPYTAGTTFVFAQRWPSWAFTADALGLSDIVTCVDWNGAVGREEFRATSLGDTLTSLTVTKALIKAEVANLKRPLVFIQGDPSYLDLCIRLFDNVDVGCICASVRNLDGSFLSPRSVRHIPSLHWRSVSHKSMAGVTSGSWLFGSTLNIAKHGGLRLSKMRRTLRHVLKTTERGTPLTDDSTSTFRALPVSRFTSRAPLGMKRFAVTAPSIFLPRASTASQVVREVTIRELMDIYDLELSVQTSLLDFWTSSGANPSREFTQQTPMKALFGPASQILAALVSPPDATASVSTEEPVVLPDIILQSELPSPAPSADPTDTFGMEPDTPPAASGASDATPAIKAVKHDDAEVNVEEWDRWTVDNYHPPTPADAPIICIPGTYNEDTKHRFQVLRKFMLRAYKRRLLRGFLKFLNLEHDDGRKRPYSVTYFLITDGVGGVRSKTPISATVDVSPWCLSKFPKRLPRRRSHKIPRNDDLLRDLIRGVDCLERAGWASFWKWKDGSSIFFWRWPSRYKKSLRDGTKLFVNRKHLPLFTDSPNLPKDPTTRQQLLDKLQVPRTKRYIKPGLVHSRTGYFAVPKGTEDIRLVYDATKCGLNRALWSPNFYLPTIDALLRNADSNTFYGDIDLGEMFLNYALDEAIRPYAGVDVSALEPDKIRSGVKAVLERWERTLMGLRPSPYVCTQTFSWGEEIIRGNRLDPNNPLRWDKVILNLPGDLNYDPTKPRVYKWNSLTGTIAGSFGTYIDDIRTQHQSESLCRSVTRKVAGGVGYLGQQDAPRKRRPPKQRPGAWAGAMCFSVKDEGLYVTCSQEKWDKGKNLVEDLFRKVVIEKNKELDRSLLEKHVGFLVHLSRTFPAIFPYLKGIYLTMESWRLGRDAEGWKFSRAAWWNLMSGALDDDDEDFDNLTFEEKRRNYLSKHQGDRPTKVRVVKSLAKDLASLKRLFNHDLPPKRLVRGNKVQEALYSFGDASGGGFGASWEKAGKTNFYAGTWGPDMKDESSNHRELRNLVESLELMEKQGSLDGTEAFIFTDNSTAEACFYKGSSSSVRLYELIVRLRELEMRAKCKVHLIHVAGTRMIEQGSDGLSRGNFTEGSMRGKSIYDFIPIAKTAAQRSDGLMDWIRDWTGEKDLEFLDPEGWFDRGHDLLPDGDRNAEGHWIPAISPGKFVWMPPPAAADVAVEELRKARHKRQESYHIFVVPRLMKPYWHKQLCKVSDIVLNIPPGHSVWGRNMHEPLTIGLCFPYLKHRPWHLRRARKLLELGRSLYGVWSENGSTERSLLRELWSLPRKLERLSPVMARQVLQGMPEGEISRRIAGKRRRRQVEEEERRGEVSVCKKRR